MDHFPHQVPDVVAVGKPRGASDVACHEDLVIPRDDAAASAAVAGCPFCDRAAYFHKIFVPARARVFRFVRQSLHCVEYGFYDENGKEYPRQRGDVFEFARSGFADDIAHNAP